MNFVVTGAASGIGRQLVTQLAAAGHVGFATDIDLARLEQTAAERHWLPSGVMTCKHDVADYRAWDELISEVVTRLKRLDLLINVAGVLRVEDVERLLPESVSLQIDVNTKGVIFGTMTAAKVMVEQGAGHIINIASMAALAPVPGISVYSASKFAVRGFSLAAAQELEPRGVRVSVVCPDAVDTPMVNYQLDYPGAALTFSGSRILSADEVARAVLGLLNGKPRRELVMPWSRGFLASISMLLPRGVHRWISSRLTRKGLAQQQVIRAQRNT
jgi:3-oxoacyl-[acyl-carrier protein] reductase